MNYDEKLYLGSMVSCSRLIDLIKIISILSGIDIAGVIVENGSRKFTVIDKKQ
jgi:hypothetical protein